MKLKIRLDTINAATKFAQIAEKCNGAVTITDGNGLCVNGKSILGALHAMEFTELWCESEHEIYSAIQEFVIE